MNKFFYEGKPFAMLFASLYFIHDAYTYKPVAIPAGILLITAASLIFFMRYQYRNRPKKGRAYKRKIS